MPMYYFHLRNSDRIEDTDGTELANMSAARDHAIGVARELMFKRLSMLGNEWSKWTMSINDCAGNELLSFRLADYPGDVDGAQ